MKIFLLIYLFHLVTSDFCVINEIDIYDGYRDALTTGSIMQYGENSLLVAGRNETGFYLFSYVREREEKLEVVKTFSMSSKYLIVDPFFGLFENVNAALYQVFETVNTDNVALFYTYGELDSLTTVHIDTSPNFGITGVLKHKNEIYGWKADGGVYLLELENGIVNDIIPDDCLYPAGMRTFFDDEIMVLVCANDTEFFQYNTVCDQYIFNDTERIFEKRTSGNCPFDIDTFYTELGNTVYYPTWEGISSTNFVDTDVVIISDLPGCSTFKIGDHVFIKKVVQDGIFRVFEYSLLSAPGEVKISLNKPIDEFLIQNNIAFFASNCDGNEQFLDVLCMLNLDTLTLEWVEDPGNRIGITGFFLINEVLYFIANDPNMGTELFFLDSDKKIQLSADIYRGQRSGRPTNFIFLGEDIFFIGENIYVGREIFTFIEQETCGDGTEVIYCNVINGYSTCVISSSGNVTYVGDVIVNMTSIFQWTNTIEGNLIVNNATLTINGTTNILGSITLTNTTVLSVSSEDLLNVRACIDPGNGILELRLTEEEIKLGKVKVLPGLCFVGTFGSFQSQDPCQKITVIETDYNADLSITFSMVNTCTRDIIIISASVVGVILIALVVIIVIIKVRPAREAILPHRDRGRKGNANKSTKRESIEMKKSRAKRASSSSAPKKSSGTSASLA